MMKGNVYLKRSGSLGKPLHKAGQAAAQRSGMVAQQPGPANRTGVKRAVRAVKPYPRDGGAQDGRQGNGFMTLLVHVAAEPGGSGFWIDANQAVQDQSLAIRKEQNSAKLGVCFVKRAHHHGRSGRDQGEHAIALGGETYGIALLQERDNGYFRSQGQRVVLLGGEVHGGF